MFLCLHCVFLFTDAYPEFHSLITRLDVRIRIDCLIAVEISFQTYIVWLCPNFTVTEGLLNDSFNRVSSCQFIYRSESGTTSSKMTMRTSGNLKSEVKV